MAIPGLTYRLVKGASLTHEEMDNNFRSVFYSSSIEDGGDTLKLHYDTPAEDSITIPLNGGSGGLTINGNVANRVVTATGTAGLIQGESNFTFDGDVLNVVGRVAVDDGVQNTFIGDQAGDSVVGAEENVAIGFQSSKNLTGFFNTSVGVGSLDNATNSSRTVALGYYSLATLSSGNSNVTIGAYAGSNLSSGAGNVHIGNAAGPSTATAESNKLYINNAAGTPLIGGDFSTQQVEFSGGVTGSSFTGSFIGDGTGLTGLAVTAEWDGTRDGDAEITGSLIVSGSDINVDFTNTLAISGSIFSGSFIGDGSGLTGLSVSSEWDGTRDGNAEITGSFIVSGSNPTINLKGDTFIDDNIHIHNNTVTSIGIGKCTFGNSTSNFSIAIGENAALDSTGDCNITIGHGAGKNQGNCSTIIGYIAGANSTGCSNTIVGHKALGGTGLSRNNSALGASALARMTSGTANTAIGYLSLQNVTNSSHNVGVGNATLQALASTHNCNTAVGSYAGSNARGSKNVFIGYGTGPQTYGALVESKLYIHNSSNNEPLIYGDFETGQLTINSQVSASIFSGSYYGDGSNLTGIQWGGTRVGDAEITGSFTVSGSSTVVDFTGTEAISGSIFSGSFVGDGSGLTGVTSEWDGSRDGNAEITGSLIVSGALDVAGDITISTQEYPGGPGVEVIHISSQGLSGVNTLRSFAINATTGYTGIKVDYSIYNGTEDEKKVGTLLGAWDQAGNSTINDSHTIATGIINSTAFSIDASSTTQAILKIDASTGTYDVNMLITAFKRQV